ncbi:MAG: BatA domain-containing protein [Pirellulaceae bacterium]|nr:BatA domain-containing protein [Pirellulaceae bacterium]
MLTANWFFVLAGVVCAAGPIIIHLLNRRRYRVVQWAAMDFLREAMQRNRRILQLRDILLLCLRTLAVLLFGLALARPGCTLRQETFDDQQPLHAIILIDNSLSMGYESLEGSLLAKAKDRARQLIDKIPAGSKFSIIPTCGSGAAISRDPYAAPDDALEALDKVEIVDRSTSLQQAATEARRAGESFPELSQRIVLISDQQRLNWPKSADALREFPPMQVVDVGPADWENTWISDLRIQDGLADTETPTTIVATVQHRGAAPRRDLQVTLTMGDTVLGERTITVEPAPGGKEVQFEVVFNSLSEIPRPDKPLFVPLKAALAPDRLAADDERFLAAPIVAALPVVFVDQYGEANEDPIQGLVGETRPLRKLLAPKTARVNAPRQLVKVRHITLDVLTTDILADARLVVVAGIADPGSTVSLLREYVGQGGQLVIAAGGNFDPAAWNTAAWLDGAGILPLPLAAEPIGEVPEVAGANLQVFHLAFDSLQGEDYFELASTSEAELRDLYGAPFFFKSVQIDASPETRAATLEAEIKRLDEELTWLAAARERREELAVKEGQGTLTETERQALIDDAAKLRELRPQWLTWAAAADFGTAADEPLPTDSASRARALDLLARKNDPRILASFELAGRPPYLVSRRIGLGEVIFSASGLASSWNTLATTPAVVMYDRILRSMTQATLPRRNFPALEKFTLPLPTEDPNQTVLLARPGQKEATEPLDIGAISTDQRGVPIVGLYQRGVYRVVGLRVAPMSAAGDMPEKPLWEVPLVVGGDAEESDLAPLSRERFDEWAAGGANLLWIGPTDDISLAGVAILGQNSWWWLALVVLALLLLEMTTLAWPAFRPEPPVGSAISPAISPVSGS